MNHQTDTIVGLLAELHQRDLLDEARREARVPRRRGSILATLRRLRRTR